MLSISSSSGNLSSSFLEKISSSLNLTSNTPPEDGIRIRDEILFLCALKSLSARPTALER
jgi:hypothetical protein